MSYVLCLCLGHEGAHDYVGIIVYDYSYGVSLPLSEHVDIFPVRLVTTFHRVFSVYPTLAVYLTSAFIGLLVE